MAIQQRQKRYGWRGGRRASAWLAGWLELQKDDLWLVRTSRHAAWVSLGAFR